MKQLISLLLIFNSMITFAQFEGSKQTYSSPKLKEEIAKHKTVAILPFSVNITYKRPPKNYDDNENKNEEKSIAKNLQQSMFTFLLMKANKYSVTFQDVNRTNALLTSKGILNKLDELTQDSVCRALGVDAVIKCNYAYEKTASEGAAIAKSIIGLGGKTGSGALTMQIYNNTSGDLLWRFYKAMDDNIMMSSDQLMERMMRKVSRNFPYEK
ncbi:MAG: hypothetical protein ABJA57_06435 [Ginsengibacter sp.]